MPIRRHQSRLSQRASVALALLAPLALAAQQPRDATPRGGATVSGRVLDPAGEPVAGATVTLATRPSWRATRTTDHDGRFAFRGLSSGRFWLNAEREGYLSTGFGAIDRSSTGSRLVIDAATELDDLTLTMTRLATVSGVVLGPDGSPASGVMVALANATGGLAGDDGVSDASGRFTIRNVHPGRFRVVTQYFSRSLGLAGRSAPVYHPGTIDPAEATLLHVEPEEDHDVGAFQIVVANGAAFSGVVLREDGTPATGARMVIGDRSGMERPALTHPPDAEGRFEFANVPPGRYMLWASLEGEVKGQLRGVALREVEIGRSGVSGAEIRLGRPGRFAGRVQFSGTHVPPDAGTVRVFVGRTGYIPAEVDVRDDGTFEHGFFPGPHVISAHALGEGGTIWRLRSAISNGVDLFARGMDFTGGSMDYSGVVLTLADAGTELSGVVSTDDGAPAPDIWVVVFPVDRAAWHAESSRIATVRPDVDGRYGVDSLPPGEYFVALTRELGGSAGRSAAFLEPLVARSVEVRLQEREPARIDLRMAARPAS